MVFCLVQRQMGLQRQLGLEASHMPFEFIHIAQGLSHLIRVPTQNFDQNRPNQHRSYSPPSTNHVTYLVHGAF